MTEGSPPGRFAIRIFEPARAMAGADATGRKNLMLLIQLRWIAVVGQIATMLAVRFGLGVALPFGPMVAVLAALVGLNVASHVRLARPTDVDRRELFVALLLDLAALTLQLSLTGGATNPFAFLYLLQVTLGAVLLDVWSTWVMVALAALCFAALTIGYRPLDLGIRPGETLFELHILGMMVCFALDAVLLVIFVTRIGANLRERDTRLAALRQQAVEEEHILRLGLLASGAAHQLGTPLATLSVILGDWRRMPALTADPDLRDEIEAMDAEVRRCKAILTEILTSAGETRSESAAVTTLHGFFDDLVASWQSTRTVARFSYANAFGDDMPIVSDTVLQQAIVNLLDNAAEASPHWVGCDVGRDGTMLVVVVSDEGPGFSPDILAAIGTPYRSSKGREGGGLGLFLVCNVVRKLGGRIIVGNRPTGGAIIRLSLPLSALSIDRGDTDGG